MPKTSTICAGIDVSKDKLDVAVAGGAGVTQVANTDAGHAELVAWLAGHGVGRIGLESTGPYAAVAVQALRAAGLEVVLFQPQQIKAFGAYRGKRAKTDRLDAALIAAATAEVATVHPAGDPRLAAWAQRLTYLDQLEADQVCWKGRLESTREPELRAKIQRRIADAAREIARERADLLARVRAEADLWRRYQLIVSVRGIGPPTALAILIRLPEIATLSREQAAALAGLAPYDDKTGRHDARSRIAGGRANLRRALYAAALPASFHWNAALVALYQRLTAKGRTHKQALCACARKLLTYALAVVQRATPWTPTPPAANGCSG